MFTEPTPVSAYALGLVGGVNLDTLSYTLPEQIVRYLLNLLHFDQK